jgi:hypothetical protein
MCAYRDKVVRVFITFRAPLHRRAACLDLQLPQGDGSRTRRLEIKPATGLHEEAKKMTTHDGFLAWGGEVCTH